MPTASAHLAALLDELWEQRLADDPVSASHYGDKRGQGRWTRFTAEQRASDLAREVAMLARIRAEVDTEALTDSERLTVRLYAHEVARRQANHRWQGNGYPIEQMHGMHARIPSFLIAIHTVDSEGDAEAYVRRLRGIGPLMDEILLELELRERAGVSPPRFVYAHVLRDCANTVRGAPFGGPGDSPLWGDLCAKVGALQLPEGQAGALLDAGRAALLEVVGPAYERLATTLRGQESRATDQDGVWKLPEGDAYYAHLVRVVTTTDLSPREIHELGLSEVARLHAEMDELRQQLGFDGDLQAFFDHMRTTDAFVLPQTEEGRATYLRRSTEAMDRARERLPAVFGRLPRADLEVRAVESWREQSAGKAFYRRGTPDGSRPGAFYVNLHRLADMPTYMLEALAFHEGIPGHHMQLALAMELDLPHVRTHSWQVAFGEGWALYAERLCRELGLYSDAYSVFGQLAAELWRATRLVVDPGIHALRWSRAQAIDYLVEHTPNPRGDAEKAVERYIVMPGQATAYQIGMLHLARLRDEAMDALGDAFELAAFHDVVIGNGAVPLDVLEELVTSWVDGVRAG